MAYITGSLTDANPGPALYALMAPALTTAGLTLVDTVTISTRTHKIWKSAAASNVQNLDWYLDIGYTTTGAGTIAVVAFEFYDPATDLGYRGPFAAATQIIDATTSSRYGATGNALETNWLGAQTAALQQSLTTTAFGYWISITADRCAMLCSTTATMVTYAGLYQADPLYAAKAGAALYPLYTGQVGGNSFSGSGALTRVPPATTLPSPGWTITMSPSSMVAATQPDVKQFPQVPTGPTNLYPTVAFPSAVMGYQNANPALGAGRFGWLRGLYVVPSNGVTRGDTCTIGGVSHVLSSTNLFVSFAFPAV